MITISAFKWVPEFAQGQVRDLRARWALEGAAPKIPASRLSRSGFAPLPTGPNSHSHIRACTTRRAAAATRKAGPGRSTSWNAIFL